MKTRNSSLDVLKFISAIFVVFIHILFNGQFGIAVKAVANFAVPIFFMCSGYFSFNAIVNGDYKKLLKRCIPIARILLFAILIFAFCELVFNGDTTFITDLKSLKTYIMFFVFNNFNDGFFIPLWFLPALIYVYFCSALVVKLKRSKLFYIFPALLLVTIIFYDLLTGYMNMTISHIFIRNFAFTGLPFFSIGYILGKIRIKKNPYLLSVIAFLGIIITLIECKYLCLDAGMYFGTILISISLFILFTNIDISIATGRIKYILSKAPLYIYVLHVPINSVFCKFGLVNDFGVLYPLIVVLVSSMISVLLSVLMFTYVHK